MSIYFFSFILLERLLEEFTAIVGYWRQIDLNRTKAYKAFFRRYDSLVKEIEENNWRFLSDNGRFFVDLFAQVKQDRLFSLLMGVSVDPDADKSYEAQEYMLAPNILEPDINSTDWNYPDVSEVFKA